MKEEPVFKAPAKYPVQEWKTKSSKGDDIWTTSLWYDNKFSCDCWGFRMRRQTCKHIKAKRSELESLYGSVYNFIMMIKDRKKS